LGGHHDLGQSGIGIAHFKRLGQGAGLLLGLVDAIDALRRVSVKLGACAAETPWSPASPWIWLPRATSPAWPGALWLTWFW